MEQNKKITENYHKIIDSAIRITRKRDYSSVTIREICADAGISIGTFYHYFESKEELFARRLSKDNEQLAAELDAKLVGHSDLEKLHIFTDFYSDMNSFCGTENLKLVLKTDARWFTTRHPVIEKLKDIIQNGQTNGTFSRELSAEELTELYSGMLRGHIYNWCMTGGQFDLRLRLRRIEKIFLHSIISSF